MSKELDMNLLNNVGVELTRLQIEGYATVVNGELIAFSLKKEHGESVLKAVKTSFDDEYVALALLTKDGIFFAGSEVIKTHDELRSKIYIAEHGDE